MASVAEVAAEHADAVLALPPDGVAVLNADDPSLAVWRDAASRAGARVVTFGLGAGADVCARVTPRADGSDARRSPRRHGSFDATLAVPGVHMARNALGGHGGSARGRRRRSARPHAVSTRSARWRDASSRAAQRRARSCSTTRTTRIPIRCAPRSTCWLRSPGTRCLVDGRHGRGRRARPRVPSRDRRVRARARHRPPVRARRPRARSGRRVRRGRRALRDSARR